MLSNEAKTDYSPPFSAIKCDPHPNILCSGRTSSEGYLISLGIPSTRIPPKTHRGNEELLHHSKTNANVDVGLLGMLLAFVHDAQPQVLDHASPETGIPSHGLITAQPWEAKSRAGRQNRAQHMRNI